MTARTAPVTLRPADESDEPFLRGLYGPLREDELRLVPGDDAQKDAFLRQQFEAQASWYQENDRGATLDFFVVDGEAAGRLYVHRGDREIRIVDIALLPEYRG